MAQRASRVAVPLAAALLGFLAVLAFTSPRQAPSRGLRRLELVDLIEQQDGRVRSLRGEIRRLERRIERAGTVPTSSEARRIRTEAGRLAAFAGNAPLAGPGLRVVLDDSSASRSPSGDPNDLVVHERDIQTVVNGLWAAGAEAVAVNGQRLTGLSAVRCAGNTLLLHGGVESPPYEVVAIGDPEAMDLRFRAAPGMDRLLATVDAFGLGFSVEAGPVRVPAGAVSPALTVAAPVA